MTDASGPRGEDPDHRAEVARLESDLLRARAEAGAWREAGEALVKEVDRLAVELAAERARLDWMQAHASVHIVRYPFGVRGPRWQVTRPTQYGKSSGEGETLRAAIDAARGGPT